MLTFKEHSKMNEGKVTSKLPKFLTDIKELRDKYPRSKLGYRESSILYDVSATITQDFESQKDGSVFLVDSMEGSFQFTFGSEYHRDFDVIG